MAKKILIDTDGVLRDFVGSCEEKYQTTLDFTVSKSVQKLLGKTHDDFIKDLDDCRFWMDMKVTKEAQPIIHMCQKYFKESDIYLISASYQTPRILAGCIWWYKKYFPDFYTRKKIVFCNEKHLLANIGTILLDDHDETCKAFSNRGGWTILMPRPWNHAYRTLFPVSRVEDELTMILNVKEVADGQERVSPACTYLQT